MIGFVAALWMLFRPAESGPADAKPRGDFAEVIRQIAARRGEDHERRREDDPIRKEGDVFVRTWRLELPDGVALQALCSDLEAEAARWGAPVTYGAEDSRGGRRVRIDFGNEAFDIHVVSAPGAPKPTPTPEPLPPTPTPTPRPPPPPGARGELVILLDDAGQKMDLVPRVAALPAAVGVAVLPFLPSSSETAVALYRAGHEIWLHLPMEPHGYPANNPGPGAVFVSMAEGEIRMTVHSALNNVPHVVGMNNHMGSKATADLTTMTWVMQEIKGRGMAFIDSRTTVDTVAETAARAQGVKTGRRNVFLDNNRSASAIRRQLDEAVYRALIDGRAVAI
ncbi:MAG: divergent polysaccharide deacetylase family protein, partial [Acidobacteria bacterium]|nr:divergent polysaccharide deacetylase family protein [Acidobacteriota bacterium]